MFSGGILECSFLHKKGNPEFLLIKKIVLTIYSKLRYCLVKYRPTFSQISTNSINHTYIIIKKYNFRPIVKYKYVFYV